MILDLAFFFDVPWVHDDLECSMKENAIKSSEIYSTLISNNVVDSILIIL